jgi:hypothetical protein
MAAALADTRADPCAALPHALALRVFSAVSVEERLRCREVCRGWCATLDDHSLWLRLDLTRADGAPCSVALLRAATVRAGGQLQALRLTCNAHAERMREALCAVAAANSATLQELRVLADAPGACFPVTTLEALLHAAPQLRKLEADVHCSGADGAHRLLRSEPPFGPLRVRLIMVSAPTSLNQPNAVVALAADVAAHVWLTALRLCHANLNDLAALDAVVDVALVRRLSSLELVWCGLSPASVPALVRLLAGNALTELIIYNHGGRLLDEPAAALLGDALRANTSLTTLRWSSCGLWDRPAGGFVLLAALAGHPRLYSIDLSGNRVRDNDADENAAFAALGALVASNAPALEQLNVSNSWLRDEGMGPLVDALRLNTHLCVLNCADNGMSEAFAHDRLLPAVRANTSLRELIVEGNGARASERAREVAALVAARWQPTS